MKTFSKLFIISLLIYWLVQDIDPHLFLKTLTNLEPFGILATFVAVFFSDLLISFRWYYLSRYQHSFISSLEATMLAFFLNIFAPAKLGDLVKIYYMHKKDNHDPKYSTSLFLIERFFDVITLTMLIAFSALFISFSTNALLFSLSLFSALLFILFILFHKRALHTLLFFIKLKKVRRALFIIVKAIRHNLSPKRAFITLVLTFIIWGGYYLNNLIFFLFATNFHLSLQQIFIASTLAFAASAIPLTPGGIGTFQAAFIVALGWYGIGKEEALGASTMLQLLYILPATLYSFYLFFTKKFLGKSSVSTKHI